MEGQPESSAQVPMVYCVIPGELARFHDLLRRHYRDAPAVEVVVERRGDVRRSGRERRRCETAEPAVERRRIRAAGGRRVADRRAASVAVEGRELPRKLRAYAAQIRFVERLEPAGLKREDVDTARLVTRIQGGEQDLFAVLYMRYFDRVFVYLRVVLDDSPTAEDAAQQVFTNALGALAGYERRSQPFRAWLFAIARNQVIDELRRRGRIESVDPVDLQRRREPSAAEEVLSGALSWISDGDLLVFVERLTLPQRQVLLLRYMLDLPFAEIAEILGRSQEDVKALHKRAVAFMRQRLDAVGRRQAPRRSRATMRRCVPQAVVLRSRRFALDP